tara:strand:+ start:2065 stop:3282 length:1218 start_codon:yes stop_codon:yes gene_type:complete
MKIIYLHQYFKFPNESGGTRSYDLACGFFKSGHEIEVITATSDQKLRTNKRWHKVQKDDLVVHYIYLPYTNNMSYFHRSIVFIKFLWFSVLKILSMKGDIILATSTPLTIGIPALVKKWIHKTPFIFEARDIWPEAVIAIGAIKNIFIKKILFFLESLIYKNASAIVTLSSDMRRSIVSRYPKLDYKYIEVIENISEIDRFQNGYDENMSILSEKIGFKPRFTVLYAGTFGKVNGISYVIKLAHKLININTEIIFVLVGDGIEKNLVIQEASDKKVLNKNVFILDSVPKSDLSQLYFECNMGSSFVLNIKELWANSANKFFDTLASGKPILINHEGWQKNEIHEENIGYVLPAEIKDEDVRKFSNYSKNTSLIAKQRENALNIAKMKYATDIAVKKYNRIFSGIL